MLRTWYQSRVLTLRLHAACSQTDSERPAKAAKESNTPRTQGGRPSAQWQRGRWFSGAKASCWPFGAQSAAKCLLSRSKPALVLQVCEDVRREVPTDEQLLNTMTIVYRRSNRLKDMSAAFAAASAARPQDEGLLRGVFTSYVRQAPDLPNSSFAGALIPTVMLRDAPRLNVCARTANV